KRPPAWRPATEELESFAPKALTTLQKLLAMPASTMDVALSAACDLVAEALDADRVDAFLHDPRRESLESLVSDLLDVARIDQGVFQIDPQAQELGAMVGELIRVMATPEHPISFAAPEEVHALVDGARVRQCLESLLSNALKHSAHDAPVAVMAAREKRGDGMWARVDVVDEGPGIPAELLPRIFD